MAEVEALCPQRVCRPNLDWHELRHFTATYLIEELRLPPRQAAQQLGHTDAGRLLMTPDEDRSGAREKLRSPAHSR